VKLGGYTSATPTSRAHPGPLYPHKIVNGCVDTPLSRLSGAYRQYIAAMARGGSESFDFAVFNRGD